MRLNFRRRFSNLIRPAEDPVKIFLISDCGFWIFNSVIILSIRNPKSAI